MTQQAQNKLVAALEECRKIMAKAVITAINKGDYTNARKYTTTSKHLVIAADVVGKRNA